MQTSHSDSWVEFLGLHPNTLRKSADEGQIKSLKNEAGQRLYDVESYRRGATCTVTVCYCRVSSPKQKNDLERQVEFMRERYPEAKIVKDIGSGLNFKRKGLLALLVRLMRGDQLTIIVAGRDRLCRFGLEIFEFMAEPNGGSIVVLSSPVHCLLSELTTDLQAILHVFSGRMHGLRSYRQKIKEDPNLPKP